MKNKILNSLISGLIGASIIVALVIMAKQNVAIEKSLPAPELSEGLRGEYGIDKNINESNIDFQGMTMADVAKKYNLIPMEEVFRQIENKLKR